MFMSAAKKCDRCGKYYVGTDTLVSTLHQGVVIPYDLCDECFDDFKNFMSGMKQETKVENDTVEPTCMNCFYSSDERYVRTICKKCDNNYSSWEPLVSDAEGGL